MRGPLRFQGSNWNPGDRIVVQLDGKRYDVPVTTSNDPIGLLRAQLIADGRNVDWRSYGGWGAFRVTGQQASGPRPLLPANDAPSLCC